MITFILNQKQITTDRAPGTTLLDFIRYEMDLPGTKIGCREGDCGACTVLEGQLKGKNVVYRSIVSCLTPLGNVHGKHIVTIEGINQVHLSPVQKALVDHSGTQCGFCTPGFVMSLTGHSLSEKKSDCQSIKASISGNICRCTGYKSIERAANDISELLVHKDIKDPIKWLVKENFLPDYFLAIPEQLTKIKKAKTRSKELNIIIGGGTDLMVRKPEEIADSDLCLYLNKKEFKGISSDEKFCYLGASTTAGEIMNSPIIQKIIPEIKTYLKLISSQPIRNMGTIAGNIVNASPIGDLSVIFLALNAEVHLASNSENRLVTLNKFFLGYKKLEIKENEHIVKIAFPIPQKTSLINFEKVSKRTHLDIASVNSAIKLEVENDTVAEISISYGGISPIPLHLKKTSGFLKGKTITPDNIIKANTFLQEEISPISDVRGTIEYKRLLARQLLFAHFIKLFPSKITANELVNKI